MDVDALITYYVDRLIYQYRAKPKARASIAILVKQLVADGLLRQIEDSFWLDSAVGAQLDILAKYVGLPRGIGPVTAKDYFGFNDYVVGEPDNDNGFRDYTDPTVNATGEWYSYTTSALLRVEVDDPVFIPMIRLKALLNVWDGTLAGAQTLLQTFLKFSDSWYGAGGSVNRVYNPDILFGVAGWSVPTWDNNTGLPVTASLATRTWALTDGATLRLQVTGTPAASKVFTVSGSSRPFAALAGQNFAFSAYLQQDGCSQVAVRMRFADALGNVLAGYGESAIVLSSATSGATLGDYDLVQGTITAPADAVEGWLEMIGTTDGSADPWLGMTKVDAHQVPALADRSSALIVDASQATANLCYSAPALVGATTGWANTYNGTGHTVTLTAEDGSGGLRYWGTLRSSVSGTPAAAAQWTTTTLPVWFDVTPGEVLDASAYLQGSGLSQISLEVVYNTSVGGFVAQDKLVAWGSPPNASASGSLSDYRRLSGFSTVPAGAQKAFLQVLAIADGTADPWVGIAQPGIQKATPTQTAPAAWTPGLDMAIAATTWYVIEANLGLDPTTLIPYLPRKVGTNVRLTFSRPGTTPSDYTYP